MTENLRSGERLDDLLAEGLKIIQSPEVFAFSLDAVLLARFVYVPIQKGNLIDLCSGNGVIPLFLSQRTKGQITGVEIQERLHDMAVRSVSLNDLQEQISIFKADLKTFKSPLGDGKYDVVTCNPPYFPISPEREINENEHLAIARHELKCTLEDCIKAASRLVRVKGKVAFVHRPERMMDIVSLMRTYKIEPKRIQFVYPKQGKEANTILVEGAKNGRPGLKLLPPIFVYNDQDEYTAEIREILYGS